MSRRANGTGSIEFHKGRWRVRVVVDGKRKTIGTYDTRAEAERMLAAHLVLVGEGVVEAPSAVTLRKLGESWLDTRELNGSAIRERVKDIANEQRLWRRHVAPSELAAKSVDAIGVRDVEAFALWLRSRPKVDAIRVKKNGEWTTKLRETGSTISTQTQKHALRLVRQAFDEAIRRELRTTNPAKLVRVRGKRSADLGDDWLRAEEIDQLLGCERIPLRDRTAYACAIGLALRADDLLALEVSSVRLDAQVPGPHVFAWIAKPDKWHRVPILPWLVPWLRAHIASLKSGTRWLFPNRAGERYVAHDFGWAEKRETGRERRPSALERAGIERRIRFHDLRGTCATHLAIGTWGRAWSELEVQRMLAHSDPKVTRRYIRRALDMLSDAAKATTLGPSAVPRCPPAISELATLSGGFEPPANGLGSPRASERSRGVAPAGGQPGDSAAIEVLRRSSRGEEIPGELAAALVASVLDAPTVRLAREIEVGGEHTARRLIELAEIVARAEGVQRANEA